MHTQVRRFWMTNWQRLLHSICFAWEVQPILDALHYFVQIGVYKLDMQEEVCVSKEWVCRLMVRVHVSRCECVDSLHRTTCWHLVELSSLGVLHYGISEKVWGMTALCGELLEGGGDWTDWKLPDCFAVFTNAPAHTNWQRFQLTTIPNLEGGLRRFGWEEETWTALPKSHSSDSKPASLSYYIENTWQWQIAFSPLACSRKIC